MSTIVGKSVLDVEIGTDYSALASPPTNQLGVIDFPAGIATTNATTSNAIQFIQSCIENGQPIRRLSNYIQKGQIQRYTQQNFIALNTQTGIVSFTGFVPLVNVNYNFAIERKDSQSFEVFRHNYVINGGTTVALTLAQFLAQVVTLVNADFNYNEITATINSTTAGELLLAGKANKSDITFEFILGTNFPTNIVPTYVGADKGVGAYPTVSEMEQYYKGYRGLQINWVPADYNGGTTFYYAQDRILAGVPTATGTLGSTTVTLTADQAGTYALRAGQAIVILGNTYVIAKKTALVIELNIPALTAIPALTPVSMYVGYDTFTVVHRHYYSGLSEGNSNAPIVSTAYVASLVAAPSAGSTALTTLLSSGTTNLAVSWIGN